MVSGEDRRRRAALMAVGGVLILVALAVGLITGLSSRAKPPTRPTSTTSRRTPPVVAPRQPAGLLPAQPAPTTQQFGASVNLLFNSGGETPRQIGSALRALRATGATVARSDALWEATEPTAPVNGVHSYDWTFDDTIATALATTGLRWLPILDYSAPWAQSVAGQDHSPPSSAAAYAAYAGAFAARYGPGGSFWRTHPELATEPVQTYEIWNEPDNAEFWTPTPDPARYADLYLAARRAIDAADPSARVIVGGLTTPTRFVPAMLAARPDLRGHVDGIGIHPYGLPSIVLAKIRDDRAMLAAQGLASVPMYVTEFGWTTSPPGALDYAEATQRPIYIQQTLAALGHLNCGLASALLYTWYSPQGNPADSQQWYGLVGPGAAPTGASAAFASGVKAARSATSALPLCG